VTTRRAHRSLAPPSPEELEARRERARLAQKERRRKHWEALDRAHAGEPAAEPVRLAVVAGSHLVPGIGVRHDCANYDTCLDNFVRGYAKRSDPNAYCRVEAHGARCQFYEPPLRERATEHMSSGRWANGGE
jgi:hypothetical protein